MDNYKYLVVEDMSYEGYNTIATVESKEEAEKIKEKLESLTEREYKIFKIPSSQILLTIQIDNNKSWFYLSQPEIYTENHPSIKLSSMGTDNTRFYYISFYICINDINDDTKGKIENAIKDFIAVKDSKPFSIKEVEDFFKISIK